MASASAPAPASRRSARARHPLPLQQPADGGVAAPTPAPRRSARARRPPPHLADSATASTSARRRTTRPRRPLPHAADRAVASTSARARRRSARGPAAQIVLPVEIWEDIFLRLDAAADLARASVACSPFRRIISDCRFLRRFRSLHSPPVLGFTDANLHAPVDPPHRLAPEARALEQAADFTFSFLPRGFRWIFRHAHEGRVLLAEPIFNNHFYDFVVCDPLYRRYVMIPRIPEDLQASAAFNGMSKNCMLPILAPAGENDDEESFRVIYSVQVCGKVVVFIFSSCNQMWRAIISTISLPNGPIECKPYYAHGCVHWLLRGKRYLLVLDTREMEFSIIDLPPSSSPSYRAIVEAGEGRLGLVSIGDDTIHLYCKNWQNNGVGAQDWQHEKLIPLPEDYRDCVWRIMGTGGHYVGLRVRHKMDLKYFVLDIKTLLLEELCTLNLYTLNFGAGFYGFPYARFPPPLALPSI